MASAARRPVSLRRRLALWLLVFAAVVSSLVFGIGVFVHEQAEHAAWRSLLGSELDAIEAHAERDPGYRWQDSDTLRLYRLDGGGAVPAALAGLADGLHDDVVVDGRLGVAQVRSTPRGRLALVLDIHDFEEMESFAQRMALLGGIALVVVTALVAWLGVGRLVRPLAALAGDIDRLRPGDPSQRVKVARGGSSELYVIAGAAEVALDQTGLPPRAALQMRRVLHTTRGVEQLVRLLLVLARDPVRLAALSEEVALEPLLARIVDDHRHLLGDKHLAIERGVVSPCVVVAPAAVVQAAIGNLLRNAIENSDSGVIRVSLAADATVVIDDPGHGMSPEEISAIHSRLARGDRGDGPDGIGLELVARLCEHLGWRLSFAPGAARGTRAVLELGRSRAQ